MKKRASVHEISTICGRPSPEDRQTAPRALNTEVDTRKNTLSGMRARLGTELPHLRRYARSLVKCPARADDLVQASLERALSREHQWNPDKGLRPWLFRILHNLHISGIRSRHREARVFKLNWHPGGVESNQHNYSELKILEEAMSQLPADYRAVLHIVAVEGFSYQEAASVLEVPVGTIRSRLSRARERLRDLLRPEIRALTRQHGASLAQRSS